MDRIALASHHYFLHRTLSILLKSSVSARNEKVLSTRKVDLPHSFSR